MSIILVIDDSAFSRTLNVRALSERGYEVTEAANGLEGLAAVKKASHDCIVLDMLMPEMDGVEFLRTLRTTNKELPVVVASADIQESRRAECEALGISAFLNKPVKASSLVEAVERAMLVGQKG